MRTVAVFLRTWCTVSAFCMAGILPVCGQDEFNPPNPPEPNTLYRVTVEARPAEAGYVSGGGKYEKGAGVYVNTSAASSTFRFVGWQKDGADYSAEMGFSYTVGEEDAHFVALYAYDPTNPSEPSLVLRHRLWLDCTPKEACSFNRESGGKVEEGEWVYLQAYANQGFVFRGWYSEGRKLSDAEGFNFSMPTEDVTVEARYVFAPDNPDEPAGGGQPDVDTGEECDVNGDKLADVTDAVAIVAAYLGKMPEVPLDKADMNRDGEVDVSDAVEVVNWYIKKN